MQDLLGTVAGLMNGDNLALLSQLTGASNANSVKKGVAAGASALLSSLADQAGTVDGAASLFSALSKADTSILDNLSGFLQNPTALAGGSSLVSNLLGDNLGSVVSKVAKTSGLPEAGIGQLLSALAPILAGTLGQSIQSGNLSLADLPKFLSDQKGFMKTLSPGLMGFLERIDANDDGNILDDLGRLTDRLFSKEK